jgi:hypothetical protein
VGVFPSVFPVISVWNRIWNGCGFGCGSTGLAVGLSEVWFAGRYPQVGCSVIPAFPLKFAPGSVLLELLETYIVGQEFLARFFSKESFRSSCEALGLMLCLSSGF